MDARDTNGQEPGEQPEVEGFGPWWPLSPEGVQTHAPDGPAAVQLCRADKALVRYPRGKSTIVFYFYAARSARDALSRVFADEIDAPGARGQGPLAFRLLAGGDAARSRLEQLYEAFVERFGAPPVLHASTDDEGSEG